MTGMADSSYLEVQMYAPGQNLLSGGAGLARCNDDCTTAAAFGIASDVASGANQSTIVIGDSGLPAVSKDFDRDLSLDSLLAGGAICYIGGPGFNDCVSWGTFTGNAYLMATYGTTAGPPMAPLATGSASNRNITPGCSTLLEASDDTDNSLANFTVGTPNPRPNSVAPTETPCAPPSGGGGGGTTTAPGNPTSPINPAGNIRQRKCKKSNRSATVAKKKKCKKKK